MPMIKLLSYLCKMTDGRKRLSGASYKKLAKEKKQHLENLAKIPKIHSFFKPFGNEGSESKFMAVILLFVEILASYYLYSCKNLFPFPASRNGLITSISIAIVFESDCFCKFVCTNFHSLSKFTKTTLKCSKR